MMANEIREVGSRRFVCNFIYIVLKARENSYQDRGGGGKICCPLSGASIGVLSSHYCKIVLSADVFKEGVSVLGLRSWVVRMLVRCRHAAGRSPAPAPDSSGRIAANVYMTLGIRVLLLLYVCCCVFIYIYKRVCVFYRCFKL